MTLDQGGCIEYDTLVVAAGAESTTFGVDGVDEHAFPLKRLEDALALRAHVLDRFEEANADPALVEDGALNVVVSGGGPTGVEMAGGLMELFTKVLQRDFPTLPVRRARVVLVELADRLLPPFSVESSERARSTLSRRGVEVRTGVGVERVEPTRVAPHGRHRRGRAHRRLGGGRDGQPPREHRSARRSAEAGGSPWRTT